MCRSARGFFPFAVMSKKKTQKQKSLSLIQKRATSHANCNRNTVARQQSRPQMFVK